jgi:hypothetical protein
MRVIKEVSYPEFKVTVFYWNNRYLLKLEQGLLEQTYKINQFDVTGEEEVLSLLDATFIEEASQRFREMRQSLQDGLARNEG